MKALLITAISAFSLTLTTLASAAPAHAGVQKFIKTKLSYRTYGPGSFGDPFMRDRCDEADQAVAKAGAEEEAKADCEAAQGTTECLVKSSRITVNGNLNERPEILAKYGIRQRGDAFGYWGCEAEAVVYGLTE